MVEKIAPVKDDLTEYFDDVYALLRQAWALRDDPERFDIIGGMLRRTGGSDTDTSIEQIQFLIEEAKRKVKTGAIT